MSAASDRDAMQAAAEDFVTHINAYHDRNNRYADYWIKREQLHGVRGDCRDWRGWEMTPYGYSYDSSSVEFGPNNPKRLWGHNVAQKEKE